MTTSVDVCTLVWPLARQASSSASVTSHDVHDDDAWLIGWNPRGLSVVVAWFLQGMTITEAMSQLAQLNSTMATGSDLHSLIKHSSLQIVGFVRGAVNRRTGEQNGSLKRRDSDEPARDPFHESHTRLRRQRNDIWLELQHGPVLGEVWCCGFRVQPCQLHVIRCDVTKSFSIRPTVFSAAGVYGPQGVRQLMSGQKPVCVAGARSNLEGVLLPPVMVTQAAPRMPLRYVRCVSTPSSGVRHRLVATQPQPYPSGSATTCPAQKEVISLDMSLSPCSTSMGSEQLPPRATVEESSEIADCTAFRASLEHSAVTMQSFSQISEYERRDEEMAAAAWVPPRLDFPTSANYGEMSGLLQMCTAGKQVRHIIMETGWHGSARLGTSSGIHGNDNRAISTDRDKVADEPLTAGGVQGSRPPQPSSLRASPHTHFPWTNEYSAQRTPQKRGSARREKSLAADGDDGSFFMRAFHRMLHHLIRMLLPLLKVMPFLSRFSCLASVMELRMRELVNFLCLLQGCTNSCGLHPVLPHLCHPRPLHREVCYWDYFARWLADGILGLLLGFLLVIGGPGLYAYARRLPRYFLFEFHMSYMDWFEGWPAGLKMNEDLNMTLCFFAKQVLALGDQLMRIAPHMVLTAALRYSGSTAETARYTGAEVAVAGGEAMSAKPMQYLWVPPSYILMWVVSSCLGASCALAIVADISMLVTLHLRLLSHVMALPYRWICSLLRSVFLQFRCLKANPLRHRIENHDFDIDQLLLATVLLTMVTFLFPTVAVYYLYFALVRTSIWWVQKSLVLLAHLMLYLPVFPVVYWFLFRGSLSGGVVLSSPTVVTERTCQTAREKCRPRGGSASGAGTYGESSYTVDLSVSSVPLPLSFMLADFRVVVSVMLSYLNPTHAIGLIFSGQRWETVKPLQLLVPHLLVNCEDPPCTLCVPTHGGGDDKR